MRLVHFGKVPKDLDLAHELHGEDAVVEGVLDVLDGNYLSCLDVDGLEDLAHRALIDQFLNIVVWEHFLVLGEVLLVVRAVRRTPGDLQRLLLLLLGSLGASLRLHLAGCGLGDGLNEVHVVGCFVFNLIIIILRAKNPYNTLNFIRW